MPTPVLTDDEIRSLRTRSQLLWGPDRPATVDAVIRRVGGLQAQVAAAARLGVRPRGPGLRAADIDRALLAERTVVRTWAMRGTLHLVATADLPALLGLLGPLMLAGMARRYRELGLDPGTRTHAVRLIRSALAVQGPMTRAELVDHLGAYGVDASGQRAPALLHRAALQGLICHGPDRGSKPTYVLLADWAGRDVGHAIESARDLEHRADREAVLADLGRRYLDAYGPAEPEDFAAWSGLPVRDARTAWALLAPELVEIATPGGTAWMTRLRYESATAVLRRSPPEQPVVRLLPAFDIYLLGYRSRTFAVPHEHARQVHPGGGLLRPAVVVDGRAVATWTTAPRHDHLEVAVEPFTDLDRLGPRVLAGLDGEVRDLGRFLEVEAVRR